MRKYLTEFIGTFFLVFTIALAVQKAGAMAALPIGSILMCMIYMGGHISGAHYNPAVTLAVYLRGRLPAAEIAPYMIAQFAGALLAALMAFSITAQIIPPKPDPVLVEAHGVLGALLAEIVFTFALALVVLNVATSKDHPNNSFYGLAIGFTVLVGAFVVGPISGGAFNPAVGTGLILVDAGVQALGPDANGASSLGNLWLYLVGPFAGGALAGYVFLIQNPTDK